MIRTKHKGIFTIEIIVAIGLMVTFIGVIAALGQSYGKLNDRLWLKHTCLTAAQAQLDAIATLGRPIDKEKFSELWPKAACVIERMDGEGQWQGLEKIEVHVTASSKRQTVTVGLCRYRTKKSEVQP